MKILRITSWVVLWVTLLEIADYSLAFQSAPTTDPVLIGFMKGTNFLPAKPLLTREEIYPAAQKMLSLERQNYKTIFSLSIASAIAALGIALTNKKQKNKEPNRQE